MNKTFDNEGNHTYSGNQIVSCHPFVSCQLSHVSVSRYFQCSVYGHTFVSRGQKYARNF